MHNHIIYVTKLVACVGAYHDILAFGSLNLKFVGMCVTCLFVHAWFKSYNKTGGKEETFLVQTEYLS